MTWAAWRLQRNETILTATILALLVAFVVPTGLTIAHAFDQYGLARCTGAITTQACASSVGAFELRFGNLFNLANFFTLIPGLVGVALAAPLLFDLEHGTYRLAWTQSVTRGRWLTTKLAVPATVALAAAGALILLLTWWRAPDVRLNGRLDNAVYDSQGIVALGYTLFAFGLAIAVGALWRRAGAALTVGFAGYIAARIFVDGWLRDRLLTPKHYTWTASQKPGSIKLNPPADLVHARILSQSGGPRAFPASKNGLAIITHHSGPLVVHTTYLPASDFWPLQLIETGLFAGAALALLALAAWRIVRRLT